ncbi:MAG: hypothetical protein M1832_003916 [Thelocarpon impressellum]|nr:MAG: hypothetical protein M1832_003916 [Thelocarpon impressellum]
MPGIIPMKVITVPGTAAQARVAQACDRCRSKKIRCDGIRPCCSQCAAVGFECRTSDKLSRRAFPRGYTESLEERVRALEGEVRELKELLDDKDDIIDILERLHVRRSPRSQAATATVSPTTTETSARNSSPVEREAARPSVGREMLAWAEAELSPIDVATGVTGVQDASDLGSTSAGERPSRKRFHSPFSQYPRLDGIGGQTASQQKMRRATAPMPTFSRGAAGQQASYSSISSDPGPPPSSSSYVSSLPATLQAFPPPPSTPLAQPRLHRPAQSLPNLDFFPFGAAADGGTGMAHNVSPEEWQQLLGSLDDASKPADAYATGTGGGGRLLELAYGPAAPMADGGGGDGFPNNTGTIGAGEGAHFAGGTVIVGEGWDGFNMGV